MSGVLSALVGLSADDDRFHFSIAITSNTANYNLYSALVSLGWNETDPLSGTVTITTGNTVYATATSAAAFRQGGAFPEGSAVTLVIESGAAIAGKGGAGGAGGEPGGAGGNGSNGGPALNVSSDISVNNQGTIAGGGGGGSGTGGASVWNGDFKNPVYYVSSGGAGGGGGAGTSLSPGIKGLGNSGVTFPAAGATTAGGDGSDGADTGGAGGARASEASNSGRTARGGGPGGAGGARGSSGSVGSNNATATGTGTAVTGIPGSAGIGGAAVIGNSNITWINEGTRLGAIT